MTATITYLITGTNKGLGRAMVASLLLRHNTTVVGTVRNPDTDEAKSLGTLPLGENSRLVVIKVDSASTTDGFDTLEARLAAHNIDHLDVVVANAGNSSGFQSALLTTADELSYDFEVNTLGLLRTYQATSPLLDRSDASNPAKKKFIFISSSIGSIGLMDKQELPGAAYGVSKAGSNYLAKEIAFERKKDGLKVGVIHPGWFQTRMGQRFADAVGMAEAPMTLEFCSQQTLEQIDKLSDETSGRFLSYNGQELPW